MKTYSSLSIDVIHFEAQDVITASNPIVNTPCNCSPACFENDTGSSIYVYKGFCSDPCSCKADNHYYPNN